MRDRENKLKAAIAGVMQYLSEEQTVIERIEPIPANIPKPWAGYSRQIIMINRDRMQRRVFKR